MGRPLRPQDIVRQGQRHAPTLGIVTLYRNLKSLVDEGWLRSVELPGEPTRYELADRPHHHHFVCTRCEQAFDVHACPPTVEDLAPDGFQVDSHEIVLFGACPACQEASRSITSPAPFKTRRLSL